MLLIDFINVGYGDSILIREIEEQRPAFTMLIDCGDLTLGEQDKKSRRIKSVDFLKKEGVNRLDLLVITHLHLDHTGGLSELIEDIRIDKFWANYLPDRQYWGKKIVLKPGFSPGADCLLTSLNIYTEVLDCLEKKGTEIRCLRKSNQAFDLGQFLKAEIFMEEDLLAEQEEIWRKALCGFASDHQLNKLDLFINNTSLRMRLLYAGRQIELPGDIYAMRWERHKIPGCSIVKLPHHGHKDSLTEELAAMLQADYAVISVSNSRSDCPSPKTIDLVKQYAKNLLFTDAVRLSDREPHDHESISFQIDKNGSIEQFYK